MSPPPELGPRDLRRFRPTTHEPPDFDQFWADGLLTARSLGGVPSLADVRSPLTSVSTLDVTFGGSGGQEHRAWYHRPNVVPADRPLPCVIEFSDVGNGRGLVHERNLYASAGFAHLVVDARGQSGGATRCDTADTTPVDTLSRVTDGLTGVRTSYLARLVVDAVRAVDSAAQLPGINPTSLATVGHGQGAWLALAAAALHTGVSMTSVDVPVLCHTWRAMTLASEGPVATIRSYVASRPDLTDQVRTSLTYLDGVHFARRCDAEAIYSVGGLDPSAPPSTVYAAANQHRGKATINDYPFNGHDGGGALQQLLVLEALRNRFTPAARSRRPNPPCRAVEPRGADSA